MEGGAGAHRGGEPGVPGLGMVDALRAELEELRSLSQEVPKLVARTEERLILRSTAHLSRYLP